MGTDEQVREEPNPFAVPLDSLVAKAHVAQEDLVEEQGEPPNPDISSDGVGAPPGYVSWMRAGG